MIEVKATTNEDKSISCAVNVDANGIEYMAEVTAIIESLMKAMKRDDIYLHATVIKMLADHPHILLGEDEDSDKAAEFERFVATTKFREGVN